MVTAVLEILKFLGDRLFPSTEDRVKLEQMLIEAQAKEAEYRAREREQMASEFIELMRATQPAPDRVYVWANTIIALVRPSISIALVLAMIFRTDTLLSLVKGFSEAGPAGWIILGPVLWWFFGRDIAKFLGRDGLVAAMSASSGNGNGSAFNGIGKSINNKKAPTRLSSGLGREIER